MINFLKQTFRSLSTFLKQTLPEYPYRLLYIEKDENHNYIAIIQVINKKEIFKMKPEEILANNSFTDSFSQRDIRTLTYLGYLGINMPKYKILAKRLSENDTQLVFAIQERGKKKPIIKTANEICLAKDIINGLTQKDAHMVGFIVGSQQVLDERKQKENILELSQKKSFLKDTLK